MQAQRVSANHGGGVAEGAAPPFAICGRPSLLLPSAACSLTLGALDRLARVLVMRGVSANLITSWSIAMALISGLLVSIGQFGWATAALTVASLGDALDGLVARRAHSASVGGALLDAAGDRYQEFFFLGGVAVYLRGSAAALVVSLLAIAGSFMVSYASAKAESFRVPVPRGLMRRPERAVCLCLGTLVASLWPSSSGLPAPMATGGLPLLVAVATVAVAANASALRRLRAIARASHA
ncbi:MAG: CDP-alcohol phosphatidyltransferase family protein [Polyangiaceae bacterium]|jgi:CDP-diacylglycerol--glycerol-3-phosphate 3-phosphatidyltransferase